MATTAMPLIGAPPALAKEWESLNWTAISNQVQRLQVRIAKAVKEKRYGRVRSLQWLLTHSFAAKALAVRRVTSNRGKNTPGVDGVVWRTPRQKMQSIRTCSGGATVPNLCAGFTFQRAAEENVLSGFPR